MVTVENLKAPILFNPFKHHLSFIRKYIDSYNQKDYNQLKIDLLKIGNSQMDLYFGELSIDNIVEEVIAFLTNFNLLEKEVFFQHIDKSGGFIKISLSDQSTWVLRKGENPTFFVHIHPARYSKYTIRIKASTLKSTIATSVCFQNSSSIGVDELNKARVNLLNLSPIKQVSSHTFEMLEMINSVHK